MLPSSTTATSPLKSPSKFRPPPLKISGSSHETFLSPLLDRPFLSRFSKDKVEGSADGELDATRSKVRRKKSKSELRTLGKAETGLPSGTVQAARGLTENQLAFIARYPETTSSGVRTSSLSPPALARASDQEGPPSRRTRSEGGSGTVQRSERVPVPSVDDARFRALFPTSPLPSLPTPSSAPSTLGSSTLAPSIELLRPSFAGEPAKLLPSASILDAFDAIERREAAGRRTTPTPLSPRRHHHHSPPTTPRSRNQSSPSFVPIPGPSPALQGSLRSRSTSLSAASGGKAVPAYAADAFYIPTPIHQRLPLPSFVPPPISSPQSIGITVRDSKGTRELPRASYGDEGVSITLRSSQRPEEVEVGWTCTTGIDEAGEGFTRWELKIRPKPSLFTDYRLARIPPLPSSSQFDNTTSPRSSISTAVDHSIQIPAHYPPPTPRKPQPSSSSSLSSDSSFGSCTPRKTRFPSGPSSDEQEKKEGARSRQVSVGGELRSPGNRFGGYIGEGGTVEVLEGRRGEREGRKGNESKWSESEGETEEEEGATSWSWVRGEEG